MAVHWPFSSPSPDTLRIERADGAYLWRADGRRILDAGGGAIVVNIGHGRAAVADAMRESALSCSYVVPTWLTPERERLVERLTRDWLPPHLARMHLTNGGSEGIETAMKIAILYQAARGLPDKTKIITRAPSYHGTTLSTAAVGGHPARKAGLGHALPSLPQAPAPYPLRCPANDVSAHCLDALEDIIRREGADTIAAFMAEPVVGASGGALVSPDGYWEGARALCDRHDILFIADEVMTGFGRTGDRFGCRHWPGDPDVLVAGKGLGGGYAPITGVFATEAIGKAIDAAGFNVMFHTFAAQPATCAAADKVLEILDDEALVERARTVGATLKERLRDVFRNHPHVAEVRGLGLLLAIEIVADRQSLAQFPAEQRIASRVADHALERGVWFYPGGNGPVRDIVLLGPPFTIGDAEIDLMADVLVQSVDAATGAADAAIAAG